MFPSRFESKLTLLLYSVVSTTFSSKPSDFEMFICIMGAIAIPPINVPITNRYPFTIKFGIDKMNYEVPGSTQFQFHLEHFSFPYKSKFKKLCANIFTSRHLQRLSLFFSKWRKAKVQIRGGLSWLVIVRSMHAHSSVNEFCSMFILIRLKRCVFFPQKMMHFSARKEE